GPAGGAVVVRAAGSAAVGVLQRVVPVAGRLRPLDQGGAVLPDAPVPRDDAVDLFDPGPRRRAKPPVQPGPRDRRRFAAPAADDGDDAATGAVGLLRAGAFSDGGVRVAGPALGGLAVPPGRGIVPRGGTARRPAVAAPAAPREGSAAQRRPGDVLF